MNEKHKDCPKCKLPMIRRACGRFGVLQKTAFRCVNCSKLRKREERRANRLKKSKKSKVRHRDVRKCTDPYIRRVLSLKSPITYDEWPKWLVELKRAELLLKRALLKV